MTAPVSADLDRLRSLGDCCAGPGPAAALDRLAGMTRQLLGVPVAVISLVEGDRQVFAGCSGTPPDLAVRWPGHPSDHGWSSRDVRADPRLADHPAVIALGAVACAAMPLTDVDGRMLGAVTAVDDHPRDWTVAELVTLSDLAAVCSSELRTRIDRHLAEEAQRHLTLRTRLSERLLGARTAVDVLRYVVDAVTAGLADWCVAAVPDALVAAHRDPDRTEGVRRLGARVAITFDGTATMSVAPGARVTPPPGVAIRVSDDVTYLTVPIVAPGSRRVLGVILLGRDGPALSDAEVSTALDIARVAGPTVASSRSHQRTQHVAEVLQRGMLTDLPTVDGLELHALYQPAAADAAVGGDWYDAFVQRDGSVMLAVGDVCGHDIEAAATMGQLRNLVRGDAYARDDEPGRLLDNLHLTMEGLGLHVAATMVLARLRRNGPGYGVEFANAGHLPPLMLCPDGSVEVWWSEPEPLLGLVPYEERSTHPRALPPGASLLLYTDGLVEQPRERLDTGVRRLAGLLAANAHLPGARLCDTLLANAPRRTDDIALLLARAPHRTAPPT